MIPTLSLCSKQINDIVRKTIISKSFIFYFQLGGDTTRRALTMSGAGNSGRAHPSLAKLRDNLINGTIDFAEVPIIDMNPEDIRVSLLIIPMMLSY